MKRIALMMVGLFALILGATALEAAQPLRFNDKRMLKFFDKDYERYRGDFEKPQPGSKAQLERLYTKLARYLKRVSRDRRQHPEILARQEKLSALRTAMDKGGSASPASSPVAATTATVVAKPAPTGLTDAQIARKFQQGYNAVYNTIRRTRGKALADEATVSGIQAKFDALQALLDSIKDPSQGFVGQMKRNHETLKKHFEKAVTRAQGQAKTARAGGGRVLVRGRRAVHKRGAGGPLAYADKRNLQFFDRKLGRIKPCFRKPGAASVATVTKGIKTLTSYLDSIRAADHPEVVRRRELMEEWKKKLASLEADTKAAAAAGDSLDGGSAASSGPVKPMPVKPKPVKPLGLVDQRFIRLFDNDLSRYKGIFDKADPRKMLLVRQCITKLKKHLKRVGFHGKRHPDFKDRLAKVRAVEEKVNAAYGDLKPLTDVERGHLGNFRAIYNKYSYNLSQNLNPISLQDPKMQAKCRKLLAKLGAPLAKITNKTFPDVMVEQSRMDQLQAKLDRALGRSQKLADTAGDVDGQLQMIQDQYPRKGFDPKLPEGAAPDQVEEWAKKLKGWLDGVPKALEFFEHARKTSIKARSKEFWQYENWFKKNVKSGIKSAIRWTTRDWASPQYQALHVSLDAQSLRNPKNVAWSIEKIKLGIFGAERLLAYQRGFDGKEDPKQVADLAAMRANIQKVMGGAKEVIKRARLGKAVTENPELLAIAERCIKSGKGGWKIGPYRRIYINYDKVHKKEVRWSGSRPYLLVWDEFQVTFAEKHEGKYWISTAMIKNYSVGGNGKWHVARFNRWREILEENIDK